MPNVAILVENNILTKFSLHSFLSVSTLSNEDKKCDFLIMKRLLDTLTPYTTPYLV